MRVRCLCATGGPADPASARAGALVTVSIDPWNVGSTMVVLGDAAHAMVPFYGQGMNSALEDCLCLDEVMEEVGGDLSKVRPRAAA